MDDEQNLGVTEARFALTILTCLLVAIGYIALLRLAGTKDPSIDVSPDENSAAVTEPVRPKESEPTLRVVPLDPDNGRNGIAKRPDLDDSKQR